MTPVGHTLTGLAIAAAAMPAAASISDRWRMAAFCVLMANAPDLPFPGWGHDRYDVSHSVFVATIGVAVTGVLFLLLRRRVSGITPTLFLAGAIAWYSHLLLDCLYGHGKGLALLWPVSDGRLALPIPWFATMKLDPLLSLHNLRVFAIEAICYGSILGAILIARRHPTDTTASSRSKSKARR